MVPIVEIERKISRLFQLSSCSKDIENHLSSYLFTGSNIVLSSNSQNARQFRKHDRMSVPSWKAGDWVDKRSYKVQNTP